MTDQELLRDYARNGSEPAFTELVRRHVDLVYSAAARIARDSTLAQDITQNVFIALAKSAKNLARHPVLAGWLHQTTRNIGANTIRSAARRQAYEQEAATMNELLIANDDSWEDLAPQLDEALVNLSEVDRDAILLRYFQRKTAHEMALTLGISDEAAQKRVNRAVERLRELLSSRSVNIGAAGLALMISANAVRSAPVAFAAGLTASVVTSTAALQSTAAVVTGKVFAFSALAKAILAVLLVAAVGAGLYGAHLLTRVRNPKLVLLGDIRPKSEPSLPAQPNPPSNPPTVNATHSKPDNGRAASVPTSQPSPRPKRI